MYNQLTFTLRKIKILIHSAHRVRLEEYYNKVNITYSVKPPITVNTPIPMKKYPVRSSEKPKQSLSTGLNNTSEQDDGIEAIPRHVNKKTTMFDY